MGHVRRDLSARDLSSTRGRSASSAIFRRYGEQKSASRSRSPSNRAATEEPPFERTASSSTRSNGRYRAGALGEGHPASGLPGAPNCGKRRKMSSIELRLTDRASRASAGGRFAVISSNSLEDRTVKALPALRGAWFARARRSPGCRGAGTKHERARHRDEGRVRPYRPSGRKPAFARPARLRAAVKTGAPE